MKLSKLFIFAAALCLQGAFSVQAQDSGQAKSKADQLNSQLDQVLTLELAAKISGFEPEQATKEYENKAAQAFGKSDKPPRECNYWWTNARTRTTTIGTNTIESAYIDKVGLSRFSSTTLERFKRNYSALTDAQKEAAAKQLQEESAAQGAKSEADKKVGETGSQLIATHQAEELSGVGEAATWYPKTNELRVFYNGLTFAIAVDISDDNAVNKRKAIELAAIIIKEKLQ